MRRFFKKILFLCLLATLGVGFWHFENNTIQTETFLVSSARLPAAFDGFRIAAITDLHGREFGADNAQLIAAVAATKPDIIVLVGDIADEFADLSILPPLCQGLSNLAPTFYVTGNHEWSMDDRTGAMEAIANNGVIILANDFRTLSIGQSQIVLAGVHDRNGPRDMESPAQLTERIRAAYPEDYLLVLNHRNDALDTWTDLGADLVLSGHGHGGVIRIPGVGGLVGADRRLFPEYDAGLYTRGGTTMAVSRGMGFTGVHFRLFNRPELMVVELHTQVTP